MSNLRFLSDVGEAPWFFVPDRGVAGGTAKLEGPGKTVDLDETQATTGDSAVSGDGKTSAGFGPRLGFKCPEFWAAGEYKLVVTEDSGVTTYLVTVVDRSSASYAADVAAWRDVVRREAEEG